MARSVVLKPTRRCERCQLPPRWCVCAGLRETSSPLQVDVLMHFMESYRPSSTGHLLRRVLPASGQHIFRKERPLVRADIVRPGRELWILHPNGEPPPADADPARLQVLLLDGTWVQATEMLRTVGRWGRRVNLPMTGESRYWLRTQGGPGRFSTMEALMFLLPALGLRETAEALRLQFELHVYASLRARGHKQQAGEFLATSPLRTALPEVLAKLDGPAT
ncbi:MAG: tRNA-uridine aminocarboxypropyltransferase [Opitutales bacterium]